MSLKYIDDTDLFWGITVRFFLREEFQNCFQLPTRFSPMSLGNTVNIPKTKLAIFSLSFDPFVFPISMAGTSIDPVAQTRMLALSLDYFFPLPTPYILLRKCLYFPFHISLGSTSFFPYHLKCTQALFLTWTTTVPQTTFGPLQSILHFKTVCVF